MNPIRKLAGQTAIYGFSTIVGRLLNYLLVPLYTYQFTDPRDFGVLTEFYAYTSFLNVILTYGMETALFNFSAKSDVKSPVYSTALLSLVFTGALFLVVTLWQAEVLARWLKYPDHADYVRWVAWILALDALAAIPFARLRQLQRAQRFAWLKILNILINIAGNLFFIGLCKWAHDTGSGGQLAWAARLYDPDIGIGYVFVANFIASAATVLFLTPEILAARLRFDLGLWRRMLRYALPLLVAGLAGMVNETLDRVLLKYLLPETIALEQLGIYGACYKIAILMTLFTQAFRYAAEPFFFSHHRQRDARELYARVMDGFVLTGSFIFLGVMLNLDWIQYLIGTRYRTGLKVVPILLMANFCLGVFFNLSIWYKLTEQTRFGTYLALWGAFVTVALNFYWIPRHGYLGAAWATLVCYASMALLSYALGQCHYPVRYDLRRILGYPALVTVVWQMTQAIPALPPIPRFLLNNGLLLLLFASALLWEQHRLKPATL